MLYWPEALRSAPWAVKLIIQYKKGCQQIYVFRLVQGLFTFTETRLQSTTLGLDKRLKDTRSETETL